MDIAEKIAYIKGLATGLELSTSTAEGRVITEILTLLEDMADYLSGMDSGMDMLYEHMANVTDDIDMLYEGYSEDDLLEHNGIYEAAPVRDNRMEPEDQVLTDYEGDLYEIICPFCGEEILLLEECLDKGTSSCPVCGTTLELDFSGTIELELLDGELDKEFS